MPTWMLAATILQSFGEYVYASAYAGALYRSRDGIRWGGFLGLLLGREWSLAVYRGRLFMGYNNGGRGTVLAVRAVCLSLKRLIQLSMATDGVYLVAMLWGMGLVHGVSLMCMSTTGRTCFSFLVGTNSEQVSKR